MIRSHQHFIAQARIAIALAAGLAIGVTAVAQSPLEQAHLAYFKGDYRTAAAQLNEVAPDEPRMPRAEQLRYWALCADVALDSGLLDKAEKLAAVHRAILRQGESTGIEEQSARVRLARIERAYANAAGKDRAAAAPHLHGAKKWLTEALAIDNGLRRNDLFWEAETQSELASILIALQLNDEARAPLGAASASAQAGCGRWLGAAARRPKDSPEEIAEFLRGVNVIRRAFLPNDRETSRNQSKFALAFIEKQLQSPGLERDAKVALLVAEANCHLQLDDPIREAQSLQNAFEAADGTKVAVVIFQQADCKFRLAELADADPEQAQGNAARSEYEAAAELYNRLLALQEPLLLWQRTECLLQLQTIHSRLEEWPAAIAAAERLVALRKESLLYDRDPNYHRANTALGSFHAKAARSELTKSSDESRDLSAARRHSRHALNALSASVEFWRQHRPTSSVDLATALNYYGEALRYDGQFREAERCLTEAQQYCDEAFDSDAVTLGEFYSNRGALLAALGMFEPARQSYEAARNIADRNTAPPETGVAVASYEAAKPIGETRRVDADLRSRGQLRAIVHLNLAQLYKSQGQYSQARDECAQALAAALSLADKDRDARAPFLLTDAALQIAEAENLHRQIHPNPRHREARERAAEEHRQVEQLFASAVTTTGEVIADGHPLHANLARHLQAMTLYRRQLLSAGDGSDLASAKQLWEEVARSTDAGDLLHVRANTALAIVALREAAALRAAAFVTAGKLHGVEQDSPAAASLRSTYEQERTEATQRLRDADAHSNTAQSMAKNLQAYPALSFQALLARAQVLNAEAQIEQAMNDATAAAAKQDDAILQLQEALELIERPRAMTTGAESQRSAYFAQFSPGFDLLINLLVERNRLPEAIAYSERRRSRTFLDQLQIAGIDLQETADAQAVEAAKTARDEYYTYLSAIETETPTAADRASRLEELQALQERFVVAEEKVRASSNYRDFIGESQSLPDKLVPRECVDRGDLALVYYVGSERGYLFVCSEKGGIEAHRLEIDADRARLLGLREPRNNAQRPLRADDIARLVEQVAQFNSKPEERSRGADLQIVASKTIDPLETNDLHRVTDLLVSVAVRARIAELRPRHVLIVPDGPLHQLAFEALPTDARNSAYLLDSLPAVCYAPSLEIFQRLQAKSETSSPQLTLLSVADPSYPEPSGDSRDAALADEFLRLLGRPRLARLPESKTESNDLLQFFPGGRQLAEQNATEAKLKSELHNSVRYLHVAAHGLVDQRYNNLFGALALTPPKTPTADDDGFLTLYEAMQLRLNGCELAVLSACETNCGPENKLESGSTMARAFFCAGARRVVCSHWRVSDDATARLIAQFMRNVATDSAQGPIDYAVALHEAKKQLRSQQSTADPFYWAPFVLQGRPTSDDAAGQRTPIADTRD